MKKNLLIVDYEDKKTQDGKRFVRFKTSCEEFGVKWMSCFDLKAAKEIKEFENKAACVECVKSGDFINIKKCYGKEAEFVGMGMIDEGVEIEVEKHSPEKNNRNATMYVSYAKDVFICLSEIESKELGIGEKRSPINDVIQQSIEVVKKFKEAFE